MPERRKSKEELRQEALSGTEKEATEDNIGEFEAYDADDLELSNEFFQFLHENDWMTTGQYSLTSDVDGPTVLSVNVILDDWGESE